MFTNFADKKKKRLSQLGHRVSDLFDFFVPGENVNCVVHICYGKVSVDTSAGDHEAKHT